MRNMIDPQVHIVSGNPCPPLTNALQMVSILCLFPLRTNSNSLMAWSLALFQSDSSFYIYKNNKIFLQLHLHCGACNYTWLMIFLLHTIHSIAKEHSISYKLLSSWRLLLTLSCSSSVFISCLETSAASRSFWMQESTVQEGSTIVCMWCVWVFVSSKGER